MAALSRADLIPELRRLDTAAFQVVGTWSAKPSRLHGPGCRRQSVEQLTEAVPLRMVKTSTRIRWPRCYNLLSVSVIRNCPQGFSKSSVLRTLGARAPQKVPPPLLSACYRGAGAVCEQAPGVSFSLQVALTHHHRNTVLPASTMKAPCSTKYAEHRYQLRGFAVPTTPNRRASRMGLGRS